MSAKSSVRSRCSLTEILVGSIVLGGALVVLGAANANDRAALAKAVEKSKKIGAAMVAHAADNDGSLPAGGAEGGDTWKNIVKPENANVWYNAVPQRLKAKAVAQLKESPEEFYHPNYPLTIPGSPYPKEFKKHTRPYFALGVSQLLYQRDDKPRKGELSLASVIKPVATVLLFERGLPGDKKVSQFQRDFTGRPNAHPTSFVGRHDKRGLLIFVDGHIETREFGDLIDNAGHILTPQKKVVWTRNPHENPN